MIKYFAFAAIGLGSLATTASAASYDALGSMSLTLTGVSAGAHAVDTDPFGDGDIDVAGTGVATEDNSAVDNGVDTIDYSASATGMTSFPFGFATSFSAANSDIFLDNFDTGDITFSFSLTYDLFVSADAGLDEFAGAAAFVDIVLDDGLSLIDVFIEELLVISDEAGLVTDSVVSGSTVFDIIVAAGDSVVMYADLGADGIAISSIPLPATAPLVLGALGGLFGLKKRRKTVS